MQTVLRHKYFKYPISECRLATGRSCIAHLIKVLKPPVVLMPSYVPEGIIVPFQRADIPIKFYRLNNGLEPDEVHLLGEMSPGALVIIIHYFGYFVRTDRIRKIVDNFNGVLFEDCAHALTGAAAQATNADIALWSLNKFLPVPDGAILRSYRNDINVTVYIGKERVLPKKVTDAYRRHLAINEKIVQSTSISEVGKLLDESDAAYEEYYQYIHADQTPYNQSLESRQAEDRAEILEEDHSLFAYPIMVKHGVRREAVHQRLLEMKIVASTLISKWNYIPDDPIFTVERDFIARHLLVPPKTAFDMHMLRREGLIE